MNQKDLYQILNVSRTADEKELKKAFRKLAKKYHPDTNQGNAQAEAKFKEVNEAYDILSDPEKRKLYDQFGMAAFDGSMGTNPGEGNPFEGFNNRNHAGGNPFEGFYSRNHAGGNPFEGFYNQNNSGGNPFEDFFGRNGSYTEYHFYGNPDGDMFGSHRSRGGNKAGFGGTGFHQTAAQHAQAEITISFEEAALGCDKQFHLTAGNNSSQNIEVHIPAGIDEGQTVRVKGKGYAGGDLLLHVHISESPVYERKGLDVYTKCRIPFATAALGGTARFQTLYGMVECHVPAGTQCGSKIRLKQKGIVSPKNPDHRGDEYVEIQIEVPRHLSPREREAIEKLASS